MNLQHPNVAIYAADIKRIRAGDVSAAQVTMRNCGEALREQLPDVRNNLAGQYALYLAEFIDRLAQDPSTARLFCLDMPKHRPKRSSDPPCLDGVPKTRAPSPDTGVTCDWADQPPKGETKPGPLLPQDYPLGTKGVREGDIAAAQMFMRYCSAAIREQLPDGRNNLAEEPAAYLADVLDRLAEDPLTARLFCLDMPNHRPIQAERSSIHRERARMVLEAYQNAKTLDEALQTVAMQKCKAPSTIRSSWKAEGWGAQVEFILSTPSSDRLKRRLPPPTRPLRKNKGGT